MRQAKGWSLVEVLICVGLLAILTSLLVPSLGEARRHARMIACRSAMHDIHQSLMGYAAANDLRLPPFSLSDLTAPSLPASGHWGGVSQAYDPAGFGRTSGARNLYVLAAERLMEPSRLICPSAPEEVQDGEAGYFPYTLQQSSYCLRFPYSDDLFKGVPQIRQYFSDQGLMRVYLMRAGGDTFPVGQYRPIVPLARVDRRYRIHPDVACGDGWYDVASDAMFSDMFWWQDRKESASARANLVSYPIRAGWSHREQFNVATGDGAVYTVRDDGTVAGNSLAPGAELDDDFFHATYAERIWQFFDAGVTGQ